MTTRYRLSEGCFFMRTKPVLFHISPPIHQRHNLAIKGIIPSKIPHQTISFMRFGFDSLIQSFSPDRTRFFQQLFFVKNFFNVFLCFYPFEDLQCAVKLLEDTFPIAHSVSPHEHHSQLIKGLGFIPWYSQMSAVSVFVQAAATLPGL